MKNATITQHFKTSHELHAIRWHLESNVMPVLNTQAVNGIINTLQKLNNGELTVNDEISPGANCTISEMCGNLKIDLIEAY